MRCGLNRDGWYHMFSPNSASNAKDAVMLLNIEHIYNLTFVSETQRDVKLD